MVADVVVVTTDGRVRTLRINRPAHENRLNLAVLEELRAGLEEADCDPAIGAVVLTGTGETFCCGGDLAEFAVGDSESYREFGRRFAGVHLAIENMGKPVLAAVNGHARAGGLSLLSICDLAIACCTARFGMPEIEAGLWPVMAMVCLNRTLSRKQAFELYYLGESFDAVRARDLGLVNWLVEDAKFADAVPHLAERLASLPVTAVRIGRSTFAGIEHRSYPDAFVYSAERLVELLTSPEAAAALASRREEPR